MKRMNHLYRVAAFVLALGLAPAAGWANRVFTDRVTGEITATPLSGKIEVDHHSYRVRVGSPADQELHGFSEGQRVELVLDGPPDSANSQVMRIILHAAS